MTRISPSDRVRNGVTQERFHVGSYNGVQTLRLVMLLELVAKLWQVEDLDSDEVQQLLVCLPDRVFDLLDLDPATELTEKDLQRIIDAGCYATLDYDSLLNNGQGPVQFTSVVSSAQVGTRPFEALVGAAKFIDHSDCDGIFSCGDVVDVLHFLDFLLDGGLILALEDPSKEFLATLRTFLSKAAMENQTVVFC